MEPNGTIKLHYGHYMNMYGLFLADLWHCKVRYYEYSKMGSLEMDQLKN